MDIKNKIALSIGFCIFIGIGVWAILDPTAAEVWTATGRKAWFKAMVIAVWGRPFGICVVIGGLLAFVGLFCTDVGDHIDFG